MSLMSFFAGVIFGCISMITVLHLINKHVKKQRKLAEKQATPYDDINFLNTKMQRCG